MNIIFLDVDGVLNNQKSMLNQEMIDDNCVINLKKILDNTNTKLVLSSTWRNREDNSGVVLYKAFKKNGIDPKLLIGKTTNFIDKGIIQNRVNEILQWVKENNVNKWIAIDDLLLTLPEGHFVQTDFIPGLNDENTKKAIELLK